MYLLVKFVIRAESLSLVVVVWYQEPKWEVTARSTMRKYSVVKHPSSILPELETPHLPLVFEYFDLFYLFSGISEQIVGKSSSSFQTCTFLWLSYLGKFKRKKKNSWVYSISSSPPHSKWHNLLLFGIRTVVIHFLCCGNTLPKCPGSIIWLCCLDSYRIAPIKQQCLKSYNPRNPN